MQRLEAEAIKHEEVEEELARQKGKNQPSTTKLPIKTTPTRNFVGTRTGGNFGGGKPTNANKGTTKQLPVCVWHTCRAKGDRHYITHFSVMTDVQKEAAKQEI